jgi:flagellar hook-associated protein 3 FlgL
MNTIGDLAHALVLRQRQGQLKTQLTQLTSELTSGRSADVRSHLDGRTATLTILHHDTALTRSYDQAAQTVAARFQHQQLALTSMANGLGAVLEPMLALQDHATTSNLTTLGSAAEQALEHIFSTLKQGHAGQPLFAGGADIGTAKAFLTNLQEALAPHASPANRAAIVSQQVNLLLAPTETPAAVRIGAEEQITPSLTAATPTLRDTTRALASLALAAKSGQGLDYLPDIRSQMLAARDGLTATQAGIGAQEHRIETVRAAHQARLSAFQQAENDMTAVDPFETAGRLEETRFQLDALYSVTARLNHLTLLEHL